MQHYKKALTLMEDIRALEIKGAKKGKATKADSLRIRKKLTELKKIITKAKRDTMPARKPAYALTRKQGELFDTYEVVA